MQAFIVSDMRLSRVVKMMTDAEHLFVSLRKCGWVVGGEEKETPRGATLLCPLSLLLLPCRVPSLSIVKWLLIHFCCCCCLEIICIVSETTQPPLPLPPDTCLRCPRPQAVKSTWKNQHNHHLKLWKVITKMLFIYNFVARCALSVLKRELRRRLPQVSSRKTSIL